MIAIRDLLIFYRSDFDLRVIDKSINWITIRSQVYEFAEFIFFSDRFLLKFQRCVIWMLHIRERKFINGKIVVDFKIFLFISRVSHIFAICTRFICLSFHLFPSLSPFFSLGFSLSRKFSAAVKDDFFFWSPRHQI